MKNSHKALAYAALLGFSLPALASTSEATNLNPKCSPTFALIDADHDGSISESEAQSHHSSIYDHFDQNSDGKVSKDEYRECATGVPAYITSKRNDATFVEMDVNGDGKLSRWEYLQAGHAKYSTSGPDDRGKVPHSRYVETMDMYYLNPDRADWNQDKFISEEEAADEARGAFAVFDRNGDGHLNSQEWVQADDLKTADRQFEAVDNNNNGVIEKDEFVRISEVEYRKDLESNSNQPSNVWRYRAYRSY